MVLNGGCEDICHLDIKGAVECSCNHNRKLLFDKKRCTKNVSIMNCSNNEFQCSSSECIPYENTCDDIAHCQDESDEDLNYCGKQLNTFYSKLLFTKFFIILILIINC